MWTYVQRQKTKLVTGFPRGAHAEDRIFVRCLELKEKRTLGLKWEPKLWSFSGTSSTLYVASLFLPSTQPTSESNGERRGTVLEQFYNYILVLKLNIIICMTNEICLRIEGSWALGAKLKSGHSFNIPPRTSRRALPISAIITSISVLKIAKIAYVLRCASWLYAVESTSGVGNLGDGAGGGVNIHQRQKRAELRAMSVRDVSRASLAFDTGRCLDQVAVSRASINKKFATVAIIDPRISLSSWVQLEDIVGQILGVTLGSLSTNGTQINECVYNCPARCRPLLVNIYKGQFTLQEVKDQTCSVSPIITIQTRKTFVTGDERGCNRSVHCKLAREHADAMIKGSLSVNNAYLSKNGVR